MNLLLPAVLNLVAGFILLFSLVLAKSSGKKGVAVPLSLLLGALALRSIFYGLELASTSIATIKTFHVMGFASMSVTGVLWVYLCSSVAEKADRHWLLRRFWMLLIPLISIVLLATNSSHMQFYRRLDLVVTDRLSYLSYVRGDIWWLNLIYAFICWIWGLSLLIAKARKGAFKLINLASYMLLFSIIPLAVILFLALAWEPWNYYRPGPLVLALSGLFLLLRYIQPRLISKSASQKGSLMGYIPDPVFIVERDKELLPLNPAAQKVLARTSTKLLHALGSSEELQLEDKIYEVKLLQEAGSDLGKDRYLLYLRDISRPAGELKSALAQLQEDSSSLQRQKLLLQEAEAAERSHSQFLTTMDHEIRTPLNSLLGFAELLQASIEDPSQQDYIKGVHRSAERLLDQIGKLSTFTGIKAGKEDKVPAKINIYRLLEESVHKVSSDAHEKGLELILVIKPNVPVHVFLDPRELSQILDNLLSNAIKFCNSGEVILRLERKDKSERSALLLFSVSDTGPGMDEQQQLDLHKALGHDKGSEAYEGRSMGLFICGMLLGKMSSRLDFETYLGKGSSFFFSLQCPYQKERISSGLAAVLPLSCLVIDDNASQAQVLKASLEQLGCSCEYFTHPLAALDYLAQKPLPDVIFVDQQMPDADGIRVISAIAQQQKQSISSLPVILMHPSLGQDEIVDECETLGIRFRLPKPITNSSLISSILLLKGQKEELEALETPVPALNPQVSLKGKTILVADDADLSISLVKSMLSAIMPELTVIGASNGVEALQMAREYDLDLVLMDIQMPELDGLETTLRLRSYPKYKSKHLPIIAMTADSSLIRQDSYLAAGMDSCLVKPVSIKDLAGVVERYLL